MSVIRRVVFDTSSLVGAALKPGSVPHQALMLALARYLVCASVQTWLELDQVMQRDRFDRYLAQPARSGFVAVLRKCMVFFPVTPDDEAALQPPCRDAMDNKFLALALVCQADVLVSSDEDLLVLHPWRDIAVLRPADFILRAGVGAT
ncbi:MAG: putative toxin-antitoxin system toxin component, PIN family [Burkholderiaceae bacterium]